MERFKFRAWDNTGKCMLDWMLLCQTAFNRLKDGEGPGCGIMYRVLTNQANANDDFGYVIMLSLGKPDKNGKEIFAGDILKYAYHRDRSGKDIAEFTEVVEWDSDLDNYVGFGINQKMEKEVIGNIFENPELL